MKVKVVESSGGSALVSIQHTDTVRDLKRKACKALWGTDGWWRAHLAILKLKGTEVGPCSALVTTCKVPAGGTIAVELPELANISAPANYKGNKKLRSLAVSPSGGTAYIGEHEGGGTVLGLEGLCHKSAEWHDDDVLCLAVSSCGRHVVSGSEDGTVKLWDADGIATGVCRHTLEAHEGMVRSVAVAGDRVLSSGDDGNVCVWDLDSGSESASLQQHKGKTVVTVAPDAAFIVTGDESGKVRLWDFESRKARGCLAGHTARVRALAVSPTSTHVASGGHDNVAFLWEVATSSAIAVLKGHSGCVKDIRYTPCGACVVTGSLDGTVRQWCAVSGQRLRSFTDHVGWVLAIAISPCSRYVLSVGEDMKLLVRPLQPPIEDDETSSGSDSEVV